MDQAKDSQVAQEEAVCNFYMFNRAYCWAGKGSYQGAAAGGFATKEEAIADFAEYVSVGDTIEGLLAAQGPQEYPAILAEVRTQAQCREVTAERHIKRALRLMFDYDDETESWDY